MFSSVADIAPPCPAVISPSLGLLLPCHVVQRSGNETTRAINSNNDVITIALPADRPLSLCKVTITLQLLSLLAHFDWNPEKDGYLGESDGR